MNIILNMFVYPIVSILLACFALIFAVPIALIFLLAFAIVIIGISLVAAFIILAIIIGLPLVALFWLYMPSHIRTMLKQMAEKKSK